MNGGGGGQCREGGGGMKIGCGGGIFVYHDMHNMISVGWGGGGECVFAKKIKVQSC